MHQMPVGDPEQHGGHPHHVRVPGGAARAGQESGRQEAALRSRGRQGMMRTSPRCGSRYETVLQDVFYVLMLPSVGLKASLFVSHHLLMSPGLPRYDEEVYMMWKWL